MEPPGFDDDVTDPGGADAHYRRAIDRWLEKERKALSSTPSAPKSHPEDLSVVGSSKDSERVRLRHDAASLLLKRMLTTAGRATQGIENQQNIQAKLNKILSDIAARAAVDIPRAQAEERQLCSDEVVRLTKERDHLAEGLDAQKVRERYVQRQYEDISVVHKRLTKDVGDATRKIEFESPRILQLQEKLAQLKEEREEAKKLAEAAQKVLQREREKDEHAAGEELSALNSKKEALTDAIATFEAEIQSKENTQGAEVNGSTKSSQSKKLKDETLNYDNQLLDLQNKLEQKQIVNRKAAKSLQKAEAEHDRVASALTDRTALYNHWGERHVIALAHHKDTMSEVAKKQQQLSKSEVDADNRRKSAKALVALVRADTSEIEDQYRDTLHDIEKIKELEVKRQNEAHRLQSDMEKAAARHKECKMEYDAGNKKRRRLELELSTKHESHSQEELVLEKQYRDGLLRLDEIGNADAVACDIIDQTVHDSSVQHSKFSREYFDMLSQKMSEAQNQMVVEEKKKIDLQSTILKLSKTLLEQKSMLEKESADFHKFSDEWNAERKTLNVPIIELKEQIAIHDAVTAELPAVRSTTEESLRRLHDETTATIQRAEAIANQLEGLSNETNQLNIEIDNNISKIEEMNDFHDNLLSEAESAKLAHEAWCKRSDNEISKVEGMVTDMAKMNPKLAEFYRDWQTVFLKTKSILVDEQQNFLIGAEQLRSYRQRKDLLGRIVSSLESLYFEVEVQLLETELIGASAMIGGGEGMVSDTERAYDINTVLRQLKAISAR